MILKKKKYFFKLLSLTLCFAFIFSSSKVLAKEVLNNNEQHEFIQLGDSYFGFKLVEKRVLKEEKSILNIFQHEKSGAKLVYFQNDDDNKMFAITFRTPTSDDTGVNHILEHSMLCGSEKFPLKEPFSKLLNSSLNSFLNALTFSDKTSYPISSRYEKDLKNLMTVYLDAVFFPKLTKNENIFKQEGWRYELNSKDAELKINGVVFNEMKGAYSNPETILQTSIYKSLFPDTIYKNSAGGDPEKIPDLTYEKFVETYKKYYHPSNANIFLYGNLNIANTLKFIHTDYLNKFNKKAIDSKIELQKPFDKRIEFTSEYSVAAGSSLAKKDMLSLNFVVDTMKDRNSYLTLQSLAYLLANAPNAPLKEALRKEGFASAVNIQIIEGFQPVFSISLKDVDALDKERFVKVVTETLKNVVKEGLNKENIQLVLKDSEINKNILSTSSMKGMLYLFTIINTLNYDLDPFLYLDDASFKAEIRDKVNCSNRYFEKFIEEKILSNPHSSLVVLKAKAGLEEEKASALKNKLREYKNSLSEKQLKALINSTEEFKKWQDTPDSPEALKTLPTLSLSDLDKSPQVYPTTEKNIEEVKLLLHPYDTNNVAYLNIYLNTKNVPEDKLNYLKLYSMLLGNINTKSNTKEDFQKLLLREEIMLMSLPSIVQRYDSPSEYTPMINLTAVFNANKISKAVPLINDMLLNSNFNDKKNIKEFIVALKNSFEEGSLNNGAMLPTASLLSTFSKAAMYDSNEKNLEFIKFLKNLEVNFDKEWDTTVKNMQEIASLINNKKNTTISLTCNNEYLEGFINELKYFTKNLGSKAFLEEKYNLKAADKNTAYVNNEKLVYVAKGGNFKAFGHSFNGTMLVSNLILNDYLFSTVRVKGGAYGASAFICQDGSLIMSSYRDPNIKETLKYFDSTSKYLKNLKLSEEDLKKFIITALGKLDAQADPNNIGKISDMMYLSKLEAEEIKKIRTEVLNTKLEDVNNFGVILSEILKENNYSVSGNKEKINENKELFKKIIDLTTTN